MRDYEFTVPAGGQDARPAGGNFIKLKYSTEEVRVIAETKDGRNIADLRMTAGTSLTLVERYETIRVSNATAGTVYASLILGLGDVQDSELTGNITVDLGATLSNAAHVVGVAAAELLATSATRRSIVILNNSAGDIYLGSDATVTTANGLKITAGQTITIDKAPQAAVFAIGSGAGLDVRTLSELN